MSFAKLNSRFSPSIVKAALALEAAAAYFERRVSSTDNEQLWLDADAGYERNLKIWREKKNGYHGAGKNADTLVAECMRDMMAERKRAAMARRAAREAREAERAKALEMIAA